MTGPPVGPSIGLSASHLLVDGITVNVNNVYDNATTSHTFRETFHPPVEILLTAMRISSTVLFQMAQGHMHTKTREVTYLKQLQSFLLSKKTRLPFIHRIFVLHLLALFSFTNSMTLHIRPVKPSDLDALTEIGIAAFPF